MGFDLKIEGQELLRFARYADKKGHTGPLTVELAVSWAALRPKFSRIYRARRLEAVRRFARFQALYEPATQVPPPGFFGPAYQRPSVHIYSKDQIAALLKAASQLGPAQGLRPRSFVTLFGLLAATGLRISEALRLTTMDIDWSQGILRVQESKFKSSRLLPVHDSTLRALRAYDQFRRRYHGSVPGNMFFVTEYATPMKYWRIYMTFRQLRRTLQWDRLDPMPRIHDLRHTFAVRCLLDWYKNDDNVHQRILALQTYMGHKKITDTYWYLSAIPALMKQGASRFERFARNEGGVSR